MGKNDYPPYHYFRCECDKAEDTERTAVEMIAHAKEKHDVDLKGLKIDRNLVVHINKKPRHASTHKWEPPGFVFYEYYG